VSAKVLSNRTADLGFEIPRNTITNLENGRKESVPVHEVAVLAAALGIAPADLLLPVATEESVSVLPETTGSTVQSGNWFVSGTDGSAPTWGTSSELSAHLEHDALVSVVQRHMDAGAAGEAVARQVVPLAARRDVMQQAGMSLPGLPEQIEGWLAIDPATGRPRYVDVLSPEAGASAGLTSDV
jgi:hypothetical protein